MYASFSIIIYVHLQLHLPLLICSRTSVWRTFQERGAHDAHGKRGQGPLLDCWKEVLARRRTGREGIGDRPPVEFCTAFGDIFTPQETVHIMYVDVGIYAYLGGVQYLGDYIISIYVWSAKGVHSIGERLESVKNSSEQWTCWYRPFFCFGDCLCTTWVQSAWKRSVFFCFLVLFWCIVLQCLGAAQQKRRACGSVVWVRRIHPEHGSKIETIRPKKCPIWFLSQAWQKIPSGK